MVGFGDGAFASAGFEGEADPASDVEAPAAAAVVSEGRAGEGGEDAGAAERRHAVAEFGVDASAGCAPRRAVRGAPGHAVVPQPRHAASRVAPGGSDAQRQTAPLGAGVEAHEARDAPFAHPAVAGREGAPAEFRRKAPRAVRPAERAADLDPGARLAVAAVLAQPRLQ